ncbi:MAG: hypothetical protein A3G24_08175 [Betaproteobacteria bacterium RIFCSPLOWO2_12_FULL_62_13]|nr:MAG: hypothetical protein A3G24_08175 [Betaproteobacteria bacterium RIFCSPLOWO2_12_FULL_62_13]
MNEQDYLAAWRVDEDAFPAEGPAEERLKFLVRYAILAPSTHNSQPWRFRISEGVLDLFADRNRSLKVIDPMNRALLISCGAALFNLRTAMYYFGCAGQARPFPDPGQSDLLARISLDMSRNHRGEWTELFKRIPRRLTNCGRFDATEVPLTVDSALQAAARAEGAWLATFKTSQAKHAVSVLIADGDRIQFDNPHFRSELAHWMHSARDKDGLPGYAKGANELLDFATPAIAFLVRTFDIGNGVAARHSELASGSPLLACLGTARDDPLAWLNAGQALQRVLLVVTAHDFHASFLNQPIEVSQLRPKLGALTGRKGYPQILLRVGRGAPGKHTPRRLLEEVLIEYARAAEPAV